MRTFALTQAQQRRLEKLAREAGRSPQTMLRFVLRDGFERCEEDVRADIVADAEAARGELVPNEQVMKEARAIIARYAGTPRKKCISKKTKQPAVPRR
jgi:predicted transcriptional regulator